MPRRTRAQDDRHGVVDLSPADADASRSAAAVDVVSEAIVIADEQGLITHLNPAATRLTGWRLDDVRGRPARYVVSLLDEASGHVVDWPTRDALAGATLAPPAGAMLLARADGAVVPVTCGVHPAVDRHGAGVGAVLTLRDLRPDRLARDTLKRAHDDLLHARKMEAVGQLAAGVAHDFSNLLTVISGDVELALDDPTLRDDVHELLVEIGNASARGAALTRQLMSLGRRDEARPREVPLNDCVLRVHALARRLIGEDIALELSLDPDAGPVVVDPALFEVALLNLATNARDAMPQGGTLALATALADLPVHPDRPGLPAGRYAVVTVHDTGDGIDNSLLSKIFEPFFTTKGDGAGTGLGLASVAGIVKQFGGSIFVSSEVRAGTTFSIVLPPAP